jgi:hypothetical protein
VITLTATTAKQRLRDHIADMAATLGAMDFDQLVAAHVKAHRVGGHITWSTQMTVEDEAHYRVLRLTTGALIDRDLPVCIGCGLLIREPVGRRYEAFCGCDTPVPHVAFATSTS